MSLPNLTIIAAIGKNNELGYKNDLIWTFREDLLSFKEITMGNYILMGENTYHSLPRKLVGRKYLVLSHSLDSIQEGQVFNNLESFLEFAKNTNDEIFVCGGGMIYKLLLPFCGKMILTEIDDQFDDATIFFPAFNKSEWKVTNSQKLIGQHNNKEIKYSRNVYTRN